MINATTTNYIDQSALMLTRDEVCSIQSLLSEITSRYLSAEDPEFLKDATVYAHDLPRRLRIACNDFRLLEPSSALFLIRGFPIDDSKIGGTPKHWDQRETPSPALAEEALLVLLGSLLGDPIGWATQQDGHIIHDVLPIQGHESSQLGSSSEELLTWHTEDAFHPYKGDYLGMMCLRNPGRVATLFANIDVTGLDETQRELLFMPLFTIRPDESHLKRNRSKVRQMDNLLEFSYKKIAQMNTIPPKISVLFGSTGSPYARIDPYFMDIVEDRPDAQLAMEAIIQSIDANLTDIVFEAGDIGFIDNFRAVHGRRPFKAKYDGKDRWLKRINVARDLRKSRDSRTSTESRLIY
jgi:Fe(II)/alpha-ketoglutarate-dependent arginine beta-hydroxylase